MCLYLKNTKKYTASKNIEVFKRFLKPSGENTETIVTPYMNKRLHKNKLLETKIGKIMPSIINVNGYIDQGFHSYSKLSTAIDKSIFCNKLVKCSADKFSSSIITIFIFFVLKVK